MHGNTTPYTCFIKFFRSYFLIREVLLLWFMLIIKADAATSFEGCHCCCCCYCPYTLQFCLMFYFHAHSVCRFWVIWGVCSLYRIFLHYLALSFHAECRLYIVLPSDCCTVSKTLAKIICVAIEQVTKIRPGNDLWCVKRKFKLTKFVILTKIITTFAVAGPRFWKSSYSCLSLDTFPHKLKMYLTVLGTSS